MDEKVKSAWMEVLQDPRATRYLLNFIDPSTLLIYMHRIPDSGLNQIRFTQSNYGKSQATTELLNMLPDLGDDWPEIFCNALEDCGERQLVVLLRDILKEKMYSTSEQKWDVLLVCPKRDEESRMYKDVINILIEEKISVVSLHKLMESSLNLSSALRRCSYTICLLSSMFLNDNLCNACCDLACTKRVTEGKSCVFYVKSKEFYDSDIPYGLVGISGVDHGSIFFERNLRTSLQPQF